MSALPMAGHSQSWQDDNFEDIYWFAGKLAGTVYMQLVLSACRRRLSADEVRLLEVAARLQP